MHNFSDFNIQLQIKSFEGDKIKIDKILNREITVLDYKIETSKFEKGNGKCLYIQVEVNGDKRVVFTGSLGLMDMIERVPKDKLPFKTTIVKENERLQFT